MRSFRQLCYVCTMKYLITERKDLLPSKYAGIVVNAKNEKQALEFCGYDEIVKNENSFCAIINGVKIYAIKLTKNIITK